MRLAGAVGAAEAIQRGKSGQLRWFIVALVGLVALAFFFVTRGIGKASQEVEDLRAELSRVKDRRPPPPVVIRQVQTEAARAPNPPEQTKSEPSDEKAKWNAMTHEQQEQYLKLVNDTRAQMAEDKFASESPDRTWSDSATRTIRAKYTGPEFQALTMSTECRSTLCKIQFSYADPMAGMLAVQQLTNVHPWQPIEAFTQFDREEKRGVSYVMREGMTFPPVKVPIR